MTDLHSIWTKRFTHYVTEKQKYLRFIVTGHLAIVFIFLIGAGGFAYSEWLQTVSPQFPSIVLTSIVVSFVTFSSPTVTLLKRADAVFLLPLEKEMETYVKKGKTYSTIVQTFLPAMTFFIFIPLLSKTTTLETFHYVFVFVGLLFLKWAFVQGQYNSTVAFLDRSVIVRSMSQWLIAFVSMYSLLSQHLYVTPILGLGYVWLMNRQAAGKPFPWELFIQEEEKRMMRFYQFANYFTDVPYVQGKKRRRAYLTPLLTKAQPLERKKTYSFLYSRQFIRTDDLFRLWLRLTLLVSIIVATVDHVLLVGLIVAVFTFATAFQVIEGLKKEPTFRMDTLFPVPSDNKTNAIRHVVLKMQIVQFIFIILFSIFMLKVEYTVFYAIISFLVTGITAYISLRKTKK